MIELRPGDIVFYPDSGHWRNRLFTLLQLWGGQMGKMTLETSMTHVGMIASEPDLIIDMKWPRPTFRFVADDMRTKIVMRPRCDEITKMRAIYWAYFHINDHYSFWQMLLGQFGFVHVHKVCSAWVATAFAEAGFSLVPDGDRLVSPNELVSSDKMDFIER